MTENATVRLKGPAGPSSLPIPPRSVWDSPLGLSDPPAPSGQSASLQRSESQGHGGQSQVDSECSKAPTRHGFSNHRFCAFIRLHFLQTQSSHASWAVITTTAGRCF